MNWRLDMAKTLLHLYPSEWRQRYGEEFEAVLEQHTISFRTLGDILIGIYDAHLSGGSTMQRLRVTAIAVFCSFFPFALAHIYYERSLIDPYAPFLSLYLVHPELRAGESMVELGGFGALFALIAGGMPIIFSIIRNAWVNKRSDIMKIMAFVPISIIVFIAITIALLVAFATKTPVKALTPFDIGLRILWLSVFFITGIGSVITISVAFLRSSCTDWLLRYTYWPAMMMTGSMFVSLAGMIIWGIGLSAEGPALFASYGYTPWFYVDTATIAFAGFVSLFFVWRGLTPFLTSLKESVGRA